MPDPIVAYHGLGKKLHRTPRCAGGAKHSYSQLTAEQAAEYIERGWADGYCRKCAA